MPKPDEISRSKLLDRLNSYFHAAACGGIDEEESKAKQRIVFIKHCDQCRGLQRAIRIVENFE